MHEFSNTAVEHSGFYSDGDDPNHHCSRTEASSSTFFLSKYCKSRCESTTKSTYRAVRELIRSGPIDAHCSGIRKPNDPKHTSRQVIVKSTHQISLLWKVLRLGLGLGRRLGALPPPPSGRLRRRRLRLGRIASSILRLARVSGRRLGRRALLTPRPRHRFRLLGLALGWD